MYVLLLPLAQTYPSCLSAAQESADRSSHSTPFHYALDNSKKVSRGNDRAWDPRNSNSRSLSGTPPCPMRPSSSKKVKGTKTQGMEVIFIPQNISFSGRLTRFVGSDAGSGGLRMGLNNFFFELSVIYFISIALYVRTSGCTILRWNSTISVINNGLFMHLPSAVSISVCK